MATKFFFPINRQVVVTIVPLLIVYGGMWYFSDQIIDGKIVLTTIGVIAATNLLLYLLTADRLPAISRLLLFSAYAFLMLTILLFLFQLRNS